MTSLIDEEAKIRRLRNKAMQQHPPSRAVYVHIQQSSRALHAALDSLSSAQDRFELYRSTILARCVLRGGDVLCVWLHKKTFICTKGGVKLNVMRDRYGSAMCLLRASLCGAYSVLLMWKSNNGWRSRRFKANVSDLKEAA